MPLTVVDQPYVLLTHPVDEALSNADDNVPLEFTTLESNLGGCTVNSAKSRITVPISGTYLVTVCISGERTNATQPGDGIQTKILVNGSSPIDTEGFPMDVFGSEQGMEWQFNLAIPLILSASDYVEAVLDNINDSDATVKKGYFSVVKLH